ncbi:MAG: porin family protein [Ginsengibacter sp.]
MKKLLIAVLCFSSLSKAKSQVYIQGGLNLANITKTSSGQTEQNNILTTFNAGISGRFNLSKTIDLETGLLFTGKGAKAETFFGTNTSDNYVKTKLNPFYLEVPLNLILRIPLQKKTNLFFHAGPYAAMGIAGKAISESKILGIINNSESNIRYSNDDPFTSREEDAGYGKLKRFDLGLNLGGGFDFGKLITKVNYGLGLTKINSTESNNGADDKNKYRVLSISLGLPLSK